MYLQYILVKFIPFIILLYHSHFLEFFNRSHFSILMHNIYTTHTLLRIFPLPPTSNWYHSMDKSCFTFQSFVFETRYFCLFKKTTLGISLWHFHVYVYQILNWFIPFIFLLSTLGPLYCDVNRFQYSMFILT
jgi:hypothetical protein